MASKIFIKIQHNYTLYNLAHFPRSFEELCFLTLDKFKDLKREGITFSYLDSDAEAICLKSDSDLDVLNEILQETQNKRIKIIVTTKDEPPKEAKKTNEEIGFLNGYFNFLNRIFQRNDVEFDRILSEGRLPCQECLGTRVVGNEPCQHCIGTGVRPYTRKLIHIEKLIENKIRKFVFIPLKEYLGIIDKENIPTPKLKSSGASHSVEEVSKFSSDSNPKERSSLVSGFNKSSVQNQLTQKKTGADLRPKTSGDVYGTNQQYFFKNMDPPSQQEQDHQEINFEDVHQESNNFNFDSDHASTNSKLQKVKKIYQILDSYKEDQDSFCGDKSCQKSVNNHKEKVREK